MGEVKRTIITEEDEERGRKEIGRKADKSRRGERRARGR